MEYLVGGPLRERHLPHPLKVSSEVNDDPLLKERHLPHLLKVSSEVMLKERHLPHLLKVSTAVDDNPLLKEWEHMLPDPDPVLTDRWRRLHPFPGQAFNKLWHDVQRTREKVAWLVRTFGAWAQPLLPKLRKYEPEYKVALHKYNHEHHTAVMADPAGGWVLAEHDWVVGFNVWNKQNRYVTDLIRNSWSMLSGIDQLLAFMITIMKFAVLQEIVPHKIKVAQSYVTEAEETPYELHTTEGQQRVIYNLDMLLKLGDLLVNDVSEAMTLGSELSASEQ
jgi:hypothetical protein